MKPIYQRESKLVGSDTVSSLLSHNSSMCDDTTQGNQARASKSRELLISLFFPEKKK